jgi:septum formation inhibitor-activating ATPase MinD
VLSYNYKPFLGNLRPSDIADRLQRTMDYVVPYEKRILVSMNTGSPYILRANRWQRFGRTIRQVIEHFEGFAVDGSRESGPQQGSVERRVPDMKTGHPQEDRGSRIARRV